ncbi:hypothetical protein JN00_0095 [Metamycoplasma subdolum]|uniref:DUF5652 domain-containing protein n=1 Tax=Metamycoplasma subdolum TaxID=92407 RepID=A0A3M0A893_9BACT|nr:hypothetical protein [Metamycoplasma subdolum]RMA79048.1 hypothetical protein JN00_0095 [Metamycoplasma subdolum]WPB50572.1 hypothetical protein R9C05_00195 [Metamycoplasma subdolum]
MQEVLNQPNMQIKEPKKQRKAFYIVFIVFLAISLLFKPWILASFLGLVQNDKIEYMWEYTLIGMAIMWLIVEFSFWIICIVESSRLKDKIPMILIILYIINPAGNILAIIGSSLAIHDAKKEEKKNMQPNFQFPFNYQQTNNMPNNQTFNNRQNPNLDEWKEFKNNSDNSTPPKNQT